MKNTYQIALILGLFVGVNASQAKAKAKVSKAKSKSQANVEIPSSTDVESDQKKTFWGKVGEALPFSTKDNKCKDSLEFAKKLANEQSTTEPVDKKLFSASKCATAAPYNEVLLKEIVLIHKELHELRVANPKAKGMKAKGGGYNLDVLNRGFKVKVKIKDGYANSTDKSGNLILGDGVQAQADGESHCSGALATVFTRTVLNAHPETTKLMSVEQLKNFDPFAIAKIVNPKKPDSQILDDYGIYGVVNNNVDGIRDVGKLFRKAGHPVLTQVNAVSSGSNKFDGFCPGDMMQWDRYSKGGHSGVYLGRKGSKIYFWSSNMSTGGYGVTCEDESDMRPKGERLTNPSNIASIPVFDGKKNLEGTFLADNITPPVEDIKKAEAVTEEDGTREVASEPTNANPKHTSNVNKGSIGRPKP